MSRLRQEWLGNIRGDVLAGLVVALAFIPEAIAFSIIAGVDPKVGLYASLSVPSPLICIIILTSIAICLGLDVRTVGDMGELPSTLPIFLIPDIPLNLETFLIILPYSAAVAAVGLLESLLTATIVDELTDTSSNKNRECISQGIANTATGFIGGMAGCAMIGQSMINVKSGGRGRLSTFCAGIFLLLMIVFLGDWVKQVPMAALVAIMIMVSIGTFSWSSIKNLKHHPRSSSIVMLVTVSVVVATHNLALGVLAGVLFSGTFFAWKISQVFRVSSRLSHDGTTRNYLVEGQLFFASVENFTAAFDFKEALDKVIIDVSHAHIWDISSVTALDMVVLKFRREGAETEIVGLNAASETLMDRLAVHDEPGALERLLGN